MDFDNFRKIVVQPAVFNTENLLEGSVEPNKRFLLLGKSYLQFYVDIPEEFIPDNNFGNKVRNKIISNDVLTIYV